MPADGAGAAAVRVLRTADPRGKAMAARAAARDWRLGRLAPVFAGPVPDRPARPDRPELLPPNRMRKRGRAGSDASRVALLHAVAHIEFVAIDLAFDMIARFAGDMPRAFADDWFRIGAEEAMHFALIERRLRALGSTYGALPAHDGLWEAAAATRHDVMARLAVVPMVLEARGLDVTPTMAARLAAGGDEASARVLRRILADEIGHVAAGVRWFGHCCGAGGFDPGETWDALVARYFRGIVKPPFNDSARAQAGLTPVYHPVLATSEGAQHKAGAS